MGTLLLVGTPGFWGYTRDLGYVPSSSAGEETSPYR